MTLPVGGPAPVTVAVKVTGAPNVVGFDEAVITVVEEAFCTVRLAVPLDVPSDADPDPV